MSIILRRSWLLIAIVLAGCGTLASPVWESSTSTAVAAANLKLTQTTATPTATLTAAPTSTPTNEPTATLEPTSTLTDEPTATLEPTEESVSLASIVESHDPENGAELFQTFQVDAGFGCSTCHNAESEDRLIGPGLLNVVNRTETRVEGQSALEYIYTSIVNPSDYVVAEFPDDLMPKNWQEIYTEDEIYDIMAYLVTLGESASTDSSSTDSADSEIVDSDSVIALPETVNVDNGAELFQTFQIDAGFGCSTCHNAESEDRLIGPGLLNVVNRAETRVEGQSALDYIYTSITDPSAFVVPEFPDDLMPKNWQEIYNDDEIYDIIAYLLTLE